MNLTHTGELGYVLYIPNEVKILTRIIAIIPYAFVLLSYIFITFSLIYKACPKFLQDFSGFMISVCTTRIYKANRSRSEIWGKTCWLLCNESVTCWEILRILGTGSRYLHYSFGMRKIVESKIWCKYFKDWYFKRVIVCMWTYVKFSFRRKKSIS